MIKKKRLSFQQIAKILRLKKPFSVATPGERKDALLAASALNLDIVTRKQDSGGFKIYFL